MMKLKEKVLEIVEIVKECPENLQAICFELLLKHHLESVTLKHNIDKRPEDDTILSESVSESSSKAKKPFLPPIEEAVKAQDDILEKDLHIKVRHFMKKYSISIEQINNLFYKENDEIASLYEDLKTTRMAEGQVRISLLQSFRNAILTGEFITRVDDVRNESSARKCYDQTNFAKNFTNNAALFDFEKYDKSMETLKLSEDGRKELAEVIKELQ